MSKCPSSIRCRDSNPRPFEHESSPKTTRPGLPTKSILPFPFKYYNSVEGKYLKVSVKMGFNKKNCTSSIRHRDSNSRPSERESPPITTRPGLPPKDLINFRYVSETMLTSMSHADGLFAKRFIPPDSLLTIYAGYSLMASKV